VNPTLAQSNDRSNGAVLIGTILLGSNPRKYFDPKEMADLESSVRAQGILQPVLLRTTADGLQLVAGERRLRAAKAVYGDEGVIPAIVREMTDEEVITAAINENKIRAGVSPTEESDEAARLVAKLDGNRDEAANQLGWPRSTLDRRLALQHCSAAVKDALNTRKILIGHAELLSAAPAASQDSVLTAIIDKGVSVEALKTMLGSKTKALASACFDKSQCASCHHNSDLQMSLLDTNVGAGFCTNWTCFDEKTDAHVMVLADQLAEEVPSVRVLEAGDIRQVIMLKPIGRGGVGEAQFESCKGCQNFGATISKLPGEEGKVERDRCFDAVCNTSKQAEYLKSQEPPPAGSIAQGATADTSKKSRPVAKAGAPVRKSVSSNVRPTAATSAIPPKVEEYRFKVWRKLVKNALVQDPVLGQSALFALIMDGDSRNIAEHAIKSRWNGIYKTDTGAPTSLAYLLVHYAQADSEARDRTNCALAATIINATSKPKVVTLLEFLKVDMSAEWQITDEYLQLLTKYEMESLAAEIGLKQHLGDKFAKVMNQKRDEIIKQFLAATGFVYTGVVPKAMDYTVKQK
jgi:ParB family chromosome partitioning protein